MSAWDDGMLYTALISVNVYQCGSCRAYDDPDHWSYQTAHVRSCGYDTEEKAQIAAENYLYNKARSTMATIRKARAERKAK